MASDDCELIALSDQDDRWYPEKLETLAAAMEHHQLVYSDQRLTLRDGTVIRDTLWVGRRRNPNSLYSATIANTIVGASAMMRRTSSTVFCPSRTPPGGSSTIIGSRLWPLRRERCAIWIFPSTTTSSTRSGRRAGLGRGGCRWIRHPGMDSSLRHPKQLFAPLLHPRRLLARFRSIYFGSYIHVALQAEVLLGRCGDRMSGSDSRALRRLIEADTSFLGALELALRPARELWGRNETLGTEWHLLKGIAWLWWVKLREVGRRSPTGAKQDATVPEFDILAFGQWRLKRWIRGRSRAAVRASSSV